jgi:hypothetical protein
MRRTVLPAVVAAALALGGCSSSGTGPEATATQPTDAAPTTTAPQPTETTETTPAPTEATEPTAEEAEDAPADEAGEPEGAELSTEAQESPEHPASVGVDGPLFATGARVAHHDGFDRVVIDFDGAGTPGWRAEYVEEAVSDEVVGEVDLAGDAIIRVSVSGVSLPVTEGELDLSQMAEGHYDASQAEVVQDVFASGIFEGWSSTVVGLDAQAPFRVFTLTEPTRLVVDVSTEES